MTQGYHESPDPMTGKAPRHQAVSQKGSTKLSNARVELITSEDDYEGVKMVTKALKPRNPIEEIQNIRVRYQGDFKFIREAFQNVARSGRDHGKQTVDVTININDNTMEISDNAGGVTAATVDDLFALGKSGWGEEVMERENPFGQGFMSFILLFNKITVKSNDVMAIFDWGNIEKIYLEKGTFDLDKAYRAWEANSIDKYGRDIFSITLENPTDNWNASEAITTAEETCKRFGFRSVLLNGKEVKLKDFSDTPSDGYEIKKIVRGKTVVEGYIIPGRADSIPMSYFEGADVCSLYNLNGLEGEINILDVKWGDNTENRDAWRYSGSRDGTPSGIEKTEALIRDRAKEIALEYIKDGSDSLIKEYEAFITKYVKYDEYKKYVGFHLIGNGVLESIKRMVKYENPNLNEYEFKKVIEGIMSSQSKLMKAAEDAKSFDKQDDTYFKEKQQEIARKKREAEEKLKELEREKETPEIIEDKQILEEETKVLDKEAQELINETKKEKIIKNKRLQQDTYESGNKLSDISKITFWVNSDEMLRYEDKLGRAEHHEYQIAIAHNKLQRKVFMTETEKFIPIEDFEYVEKQDVTLKNVGPKNAKERRLQWVFNTFLGASKYNNFNIHIASFTFITHLSIPGTNITETKENDGVGAFAQGKDIYIEREIKYGFSRDGAMHGFNGIKTLYPYLDYNEFDIENKTIGWGDITAFLKVLTLLSHELAHAAYGTSDNTVTHAETAMKIEAEFDTIIAEHRGRTILEKGSEIPNKIRKDLDIGINDTVGVTFFEGTEEEIEKEAKKEIISFKKGDYITLKSEEPKRLGRVESVESPGIYNVEFYSGNDEYKYVKKEYISMPIMQTEENPGTNLEHTNLKIGGLYEYNDSLVHIYKIDLRENIAWAMRYENEFDFTPDIAYDIRPEDIYKLKPVKMEVKKKFVRRQLLYALNKRKERLPTSISFSDLSYFTQRGISMDAYNWNYAVYKIMDDILIEKDWKFKGQTVFRLNLENLEKAVQQELE